MIALERTPGPVESKNEGYRNLVETAVQEHCLQKLLQLIGVAPGNPACSEAHRYVPRVDQAQLELEVATIQAEMNARGFVGKGQLVHSVVLMRAIMVPTDNRLLSMALSRIWVLGTYCDDICEYSRENSYCLLKSAFKVAQPASLLADYCDFAFSELARFCDAGVLAVLRFYFHQPAVGSLFEAELQNTGMQYVAGGAEYIRAMTGFCEFWFLSLQFSDESLNFERNKLFWLEIMEAGIAYLLTMNDVLSAYKEAVAEIEFANSVLYKRSMKHKVPYVKVFQQAVDEGLDAYDFILSAAPPEEPVRRSLLENYMKGYFYWHLYSARYRWKDVFPGLTYLEEGFR
ncbi:hypothetical protein STIAU_5020 [Stigmatella aurantiaca DW4/3-1]|nr:hypothetical protein STIAU_5020 [Stigmatella aurantiaca DW4/3-1]